MLRRIYIDNQRSFQFLQKLLISWKVNHEHRHRANQRRSRRFPVYLKPIISPL